MYFTAESFGVIKSVHHMVKTPNIDLLLHQVVLGTTEGGSVFGAYNPRGWIGEPCILPTIVTHSIMPICDWLSVAGTHAQDRARR